jgi:AmmeMemoRadiSam system protein B
MSGEVGPSAALVPRPMAVAGSFYPAGSGELATTMDELLRAARSAFPTPRGLAPAAVAGILVPHAGLVYSGVVAATAWHALLSPALPPAASSAPSGPPATIVLLGTNHGAAWLDGVGAWDRGPWRTPLGDVPIDHALTEALLGLGAPFGADAHCHLGEHSLEVQLPFVRRLAPDARIVALAVGTGTGARAIEAGDRLGRLLAARRSAGDRILLAISSDMAHYPTAATCERATATLLPSIVGLAPESLATAEAGVARREPGVSCGMCGIAPAVLGLAALRAMGAAPGVPLAAATSADAGGDPRRTVGYLAVAFPA